MKRIEINDQLRHRIALELTDRQMAEADRKYEAVKGKMKNAFIDAESGVKVKLTSVAFERDQMWPREVCADKVVTSGVAARKAYILRRLGTYGDCPVYFRNVQDRSVAEKGERALWDRFAENCNEMEVL